MVTPTPLSLGSMPSADDIETQRILDANKAGAQADRERAAALRQSRERIDARTGEILSEPPAAPPTTRSYGENSNRWEGEHPNDGNGYDSTFRGSPDALGGPDGQGGPEQEAPADLTEADIIELRARRNQREADARAMQARSVLVNEPNSPDQAAADLSLAGELGLNRLEVEADREGARRRKTAERIDRYLTESPKLRTWLDDPENLVVAHDDETLGFFERAAKQIGTPTLGEVGQAAGNIGPQFLYSLLGLNEAILDAPRALGETIQGLPGQDYKYSWANILKGVSDRAKGGMEGLSGGSYEAQRKALSASIAANAPQGDTWLESGIYDAIQSSGSSVLAAVSSIATGNPATGLTIMGGVSGGAGFADARNEGRSASQALRYGITMGSIEVATEALPLTALVDDILKGTGFGKTLLKNIAAEGVTEQVATFLQDAATALELQPEKTFGEFMAERPEAALRTLVASTLMSTVQTSVAKGADVGLRAVDEQRRIQMAADRQRMFQALGESAKASDLKRRLPKKYREFVEQATKDGPLETVSIPADQFDAYFQSKQIDPREFAAGLEVPIEVYEEALLRGDDLVIPMGVFAEKVAGGEHDAGLVPHLRLSPNDFTAFEAEQKAGEFEAVFGEELKRFQDAQELSADLAESETRVLEAVIESLKATGVYEKRAVVPANAAVMAAMVTTLGKRTGEDPMAIWETYGPQVRGMVGSEMTGLELSQTAMADLIKPMGFKTGFTGVGARGPRRTFEPRDVVLAHNDGDSILDMVFDFGMDEGSADARTHLSVLISNIRHSVRTAQEQGQTEELAKAWNVTADELERFATPRPNAGNAISDETLRLIELAAQGLKNKEIAERLGKTPDQVKALKSQRKALIEARRAEIVAKRAGQELNQTEGGALTADDLLSPDGIRMIASGSKGVPSAADLVEAANRIKQAEADDLVRQFGGDEAKAKRWQSLWNRAERADPATAARLDAEREALSNSVPYVEPSEFADAYQLRALARAFEEMESSPDAIAGALAERLTDLPTVRELQDGQITSRALSAMAVLRKASTEARLQNLSPQQVLSDALNIYKRRFDDPQDAAFMVGEVENLFAAFASGTKIPNLLAQEKRGAFLRMPGQRSEIRLFEARDLSTFMHEASHWYLDLLVQMGQGENPHPFVLEQLAAVAKWKGLDALPAMYSPVPFYSKARQRDLPAGSISEEWLEMQESFAETFEAYLREGKAPSRDLRDVFASFRQWLLSLYKSIRNIGSRVDLTPEIKGVFDRMLATDEAMAEASAGIEADAEALAKAMFDKGAIKTEAELERVKKRLATEREQATAEMSADLIRRVMATQKAKYLEDRRKERNEAIMTVDQRPEQRALAYLSRGEWMGDVVVARELGDDYYEQGGGTPEALGQERTRGNLETTDPGVESFWDDRLTPVRNKMVEMAINGFSTQEIADEVDTTETTVRVTLSKIRAKFPDIDVPKAKTGPANRRVVEAIVEIVESANRAGQTITQDTIAARMRARGYEGFTAKNVSVRLSWTRTGKDASVTPEVRERVLALKMAGPWAEDGQSLAQSGDRPELDALGLPLYQSRDSSAPGWGPVPPPPNLPPMRLDLQAVREMHGDDALKRLPPEVVQFSATATDIDQLLTVARDVAASRRGQKPKTMWQFFARRRVIGEGMNKVAYVGIRDPGGEILSMIGEKKAYPGLLAERENDTPTVRSYTIHDAAIAAWEAGYTPGEAPLDDNAFLDLLRQDVDGSQPVYREEDQDRVRILEAADRWAAWFDETMSVNVNERNTELLRRQIAASIDPASENKLAPDQAAEILNGALGRPAFRTGEDLLNALSLAQNREKAIKEETDRRMREKYGPDPFRDGTIMEMARTYANGEMAHRRGEIELDALSRAAGLPAASRLAKQLARRQLQAMTVKQVQGYRTFLANERRWMKAAIAATKKGDLREAALHRQRALVNQQLYYEGEKLAERIEKTRKHMIDYGHRAKQVTLRKAGDDYAEQMQALLEEYEFVKRGPKALEQRQSLAAWFAQKQADLDPLVDTSTMTVEERVIREEEALERSRALQDMQAEARQKNYVNLTVEELESVRTQADAIWTMAKLKDKILTEQQRVSLKLAAADLAASIEANQPNPLPKAPLESDTPDQKQKRNLAGYLEGHRTLQSLAREFDGGKDGGAFWRFIVKPLNAAFARLSTMRGQASKDISELFSLYSDKEIRGLDRGKQYIAAIDNVLTKQGRIAVALNWGTEKGRARVMDSEGWSEAQVQAILSTLDQRDWQFVQNVWKYLDSFWAEYSATHLAVHGVPMTKEPGIEVATRFGVIQGNYYPIKFDAARSAKSDQRSLEADAKGMAGRVGTRVTRGSSISRVEGKVTIPLRLSVFDVITQHVDEVMTSIATDRAMLDVGRMIMRPEVQNAIVERHGMVKYRAIVSTLREAKNGQEVARETWEKAVIHLRNGQTIVGLGLNLMTAALQPLGLGNSVVRVGGYWMARGIARAGRTAVGRENAVKFIVARSEMMQNREKSQTRELADLRNKLKRRTVPQWVEDSYFFFITKTQFLVVDVPTWFGQFEKSIAAGASEADAAAQADQAVIDAQGTGEVHGLAGVQRGSPLWRLFTNFMSYMVTTYNLSAQRIANANVRGPLSAMSLGIDMLILWALPVAGSMILREVLTGGGDDGEDEDLWLTYLKEQIRFLMGPFAIVNQLAGALGGYGYRGPQGLQSIAEGSAAVAATTRAAEATIQGEEADWLAVLRPANKAAGAIFHYPAGQVDRTVRGLNQLYTGETDDLSVILFGPKKAA